MQRRVVADRAWMQASDESRPYALLLVLLRLQLAELLLDQNENSKEGIDELRQQITGQLDALGLPAKAVAGLTQVGEILSPTRSHFDRIGDGLLTTIAKPSRW